MIYFVGLLYINLQQGIPRQQWKEIITRYQVKQNLKSVLNTESLCIYKSVTVSWKIDFASCFETVIKTQHRWVWTADTWFSLQESRLEETVPQTRLTSVCPAPWPVHQLEGYWSVPAHLLTWPKVTKVAAVSILLTHLVLRHCSQCSHSSLRVFSKEAGNVGCAKCDYVRNYSI